MTVAINRADAGRVATVSAACLAGWVIGVHVLRVRFGSGGALVRG
ncbi:conserved hypothetical protein [Actinomyces sp. oral taxon 180 str. F0310]|nr:conserved hypothetical protein [Actinomyces sp. oral taxon 180 str. F0310]